MLTTYTKLEDVPEGIREHYKLIDGKYVPEISEDHPVKVNNAKLLTEKATAETQVVNLKTEVETAKADAHAAKASGLPRGHEAVPKADADLARGVKAAGVTTIEAFTALTTEHSNFKQKAETADREKHAASVGELLEWDKDKTALLVPAIFDLSQVELRDGKDGKKEAIARVKQSDGSFVEKPFSEVISATPALTALLPSLTVARQPDGTPLPSQGAGGGGAETDLIAQRIKTRDAARTANPNPLMPKVAAAA